MIFCTNKIDFTSSILHFEFFKSVHKQSGNFNFKFLTFLRLVSLNLAAFNSDFVVLCCELHSKDDCLTSPQRASRARSVSHA